MSDPTPNPTSNVKIYDRPERAMPSPLILLLIVLVAALCCFFLYRAMHPAAPATGAAQGVLVAPAVVRSLNSSGQRPNLRRTAEHFADLM